MGKPHFYNKRTPSITVGQLKRYGYSASALFALLSMSTVLLFGSPSYAVSPATRTFNYIVYPILILIGILGIWAIINRRLPIEKVEKPAVGILAFFFVAKFSVTLLTAPDVLPLSHVESWYWVMVGVWTLAFLACAFFMALAINLTMYAIVVAVTVANVLLRAEPAAMWDLMSDIVASNLRLACFLTPLVILGYVKHQWIIVEKEAMLLRTISHKDPLTGLANRRQLNNTLEAAVSDGRHDLTVIMFDLDGFKQVNDSLGHAAGDEVLRHIGELAADQVRADDTVGRWGGEEFLVICPHTDLVAGERVAERLRQALSAGAMPHGQHVTASFGVAQLHPQETAAQLIVRADRALYEAKARGKNRVVCAQSGSDSPAYAANTG